METGSDAAWRHAFHIDRRSAFRTDIDFEDCVHQEFSSADDVGVGGSNNPTCILRHFNHMKVRVLDTGNPIQNAVVTVYDRSGTAVANGVTDATGYCTPTRIGEATNDHLHDRILVDTRCQAALGEDALHLLDGHGWVKVDGPVVSNPISRRQDQQVRAFG